MTSFKRIESLLIEGFKCRWKYKFPFCKFLSLCSVPTDQSENNKSYNISKVGYFTVFSPSLPPYL